MAHRNMPMAMVLMVLHIIIVWSNRYFYKTLVTILDARKYTSLLPNTLISYKHKIITSDVAVVVLVNSQCLIFISYWHCQ